MHPHLSARMQKIIGLANEVAHEAGLEYVGTEHVLLAVMREGTGMAAAVLTEHGLTEKIIKDEIEHLVEDRLEQSWVFGRLPGTPHYRNVVSVAVDQSQQLESKEVCSEHLLLALLKESGSVACEALVNLGITYDHFRQEVLARM
jgi:ATP-dependent Clp protease ATP-binding subunit ClpC